jgi:hypothetical protein
LYTSLKFTINGDHGALYDHKGGILQVLHHQSTIDFIFGSASSLDGVELEVDGALDGADLKYICIPLWSYSAPWPPSIDGALDLGVNLITLRPHPFS